MLRIYNTLTRKKEVFEPMNPPAVKMYACGITVSGDAHIGHAYQALIYDIVRKYLQKSGYEVTYARNYTDVDDKIIAKSKETGIPADRYAEMMIKRIDKVMRELKIDDPDIWLKATCNIDNIIDFTSALIEKGYAYPTPNGDVYFAVEKFSDYGKLSGRNLDDALNGVRVENDEEKRNPLDFALWKSAKDGEICWDSPWGKGRPGWHIECSAMNRAAFGDQIDIHGGGRDLIFPHHENEIAQTEALTGKRFAKYWIHNGLIKVNGQKMSKSLGNSIVLGDLMAEYDDETIKFALLQTNYRGDINVTDDLFPNAEKHMYGFYKIMDEAEKSGLKSDDFTKSVDDDFNAAMDDDFNTALAISNLFGLFKKVKAKLKAGDASAVADINQIKKTYSLLGLFQKRPSAFCARYEAKHPEAAKAEKTETCDAPEEVLQLAKSRMEAKKAKNYALADEIRSKISDLGYTVVDVPGGFDLKKN